MKKGNVTAESITVTRQSRATEAEIEKLAIDIRDNGLRNPVLVSSFGVLLDGLNRFLAYKLLGWSVVPAKFAAEPTEAADELERLRNGEIIGYQRAMELYEDFRTFSKQTDVLRRTGRPRGTKLPAYEGARHATARSAGISENAINRISVLINLARSGNDEATGIIDRCFASPPGSPIIGFHRALELRALQRDIMPMETDERTRVLLDILKATETSLKQISRVGGIHVLSTEDINTLSDKLKDISQLVAAIKKELKRRSQGE